MPPSSWKVGVMSQMLASGQASPTSFIIPRISRSVRSRPQGS
jgi:hypothetical protein